MARNHRRLATRAEVRGGLRSCSGLLSRGGLWARLGRSLRDDADSDAGVVVSRDRSPRRRSSPCRDAAAAEAGVVMGSDRMLGEPPTLKRPWSDGDASGQGFWGVSATAELRPSEVAERRGWPQRSSWTLSRKRESPGAFTSSDS